MKDEVFARLSNDATMIGLLPGGIYDAEVVDEISEQKTPAAYDTDWLSFRPCMLVKQGAIVTDGPVPTATRQTITLYFYQPRGSSIINQARKRAFALLHDIRLTPASGGAYELQHTDSILTVDDVLDTQLWVSRYAVYTT